MIQIIAILGKTCLTDSIVYKNKLFWEKWKFSWFRSFNTFKGTNIKKKITKALNIMEHTSINKYFYVNKCIKKIDYKLLTCCNKFPPKIGVNQTLVWVG